MAAAWVKLPREPPGWGFFCWMCVMLRGGKGWVATHLAVGCRVCNAANLLPAVMCLAASLFRVCVHMFAPGASCRCSTLCTAAEWALPCQMRVMLCLEELCWCGQMRVSLLLQGERDQQQVACLVWQQLDF
jgi:hypothetical protein